MRRTIAILILISLFSVSYSQIIKGKVMDSNTKNGIEFAAVYFNGTSFIENKFVCFMNRVVMALLSCLSNVVFLIHKNIAPGSWKLFANE